ncbi:GlxA family transcriptional regulator [Thalassococcus sp. S3]|uniref:GlxA family transcriptional regulator n=1 Tax=Thalassococcus sp. S3 TaxID=2017482 RepID=UPI00102443DE|nr:DJ-1/PfpI family protein [Thalassococcus sp. S3]QBF32335.1 AraC family transcriptional regulator [Thalassococcus sp. S3]
MDKPRRQIDVLLFDGVTLLDVSGPTHVFGNAQRDGKQAYSLRYASSDGAPVTAACGLRLTPDIGLHDASGADYLLVPGGMGVDEALKNRPLLDYLASWRGERLISICSGSVLLAHAGILDGRPATTHWQREQFVKRHYPSVDWDIDKLYIKDGHVHTSGGVTAGIDLALFILKQDCGAAAALSAARGMLVHLSRSGDQSQFNDVLSAQFSADSQLSDLIDKVAQHPSRAWTLAEMADFAGTTPRTLTRRFNAQLGVSPTKFVEAVRVRLAADRLAAGMSVANVVRSTGFGDHQRMQRAFKRQLQSTVKDYERRVR